MTQAFVTELEHVEGQDATILARPVQYQDGPAIVRSDIEITDTETNETAVKLFVYDTSLDITPESTYAFPGGAGATIPGERGLVYRRIDENGLTRELTFETALVYDREWPLEAPGYTFKYTIPHVDNDPAAFTGTELDTASGVNWRAGTTFRVVFTVLTQNPPGLTTFAMVFDITPIGAEQ